MAHTVKAFEVLRRGGKPSDPILKRAVANRRLVERVTMSKPAEGERGFQWKRRGQETWKKVGTKVGLLEALGDASLRIGDALYARRTGSRVVYVLRAVEFFPIHPVPPVPDPNATEGVKVLWRDVFECTDQVERATGRSLDVVSMGIFACRRIDGSSTWSQHAFHNALDFRIRRSDAPLLSIDGDSTTRVVSKVRVRGHAAEILWQVSGHYFHAHLTAEPKRFGTPACA
jgi:hypothetical protein